MPVQSWGHSQYWSVFSTVVPPPPTPIISRGGYPGWQASVIGSLFGAIQVQLVALWAEIRWYLRLIRRVRALDARQQVALAAAFHALEHPGFPAALTAVQETAVTLGFNRPEAWKPYSHAIKASPKRAENIFRHLRACEQTKAALGSTLSNPECNLLVELAYHAFARKGR